MFFIYFVLIEGKVQVGAVFFGASTTNLLVSIFSQIFVVLAAMTVHGLLTTLRLVLKDASLVTFFGIGSSSGWSSVLQLLAAGWFPKLWCNFTSVLLGRRLVAGGNTWDSYRGSCLRIRVKMSAKSSSTRLCPFLLTKFAKQTVQHLSIISFQGISKFLYSLVLFPLTTGSLTLFRRPFFVYT
jgi:hypothetical protein